LRGNIRVFVRCRPFLPCDHEQLQLQQQQQELQQGEMDAHQVGEHLQFHDDDCSLSLVPTHSAKAHHFSFDRIFRASSSQAEVYGEVHDLVQSVLDGYRVCVFSYGQTGSGKVRTLSLSHSRTFSH
jgi:hypothetical protein